MGFQTNFTVGQAVEISGSVETSPIPDTASYTPIISTIQSNGATLVTAHTPAAGKKFYLFGMSAVSSNATSYNWVLYDTDGSTAIARGVINDDQGPQTIPFNGKVYDGNSQPVKFNVTAAATNTFQFVVWGLEEV